MKTKPVSLQACDIDSEIKKIAAVYSEADREMFSDNLHNILKSSNLVKILDDDKVYGSGTLREVLRICTILGKIDTSLGWVVGVSNSAWSIKNNFHFLEACNLEIERNKILAMVLGRPGSLKKEIHSDNYLLNGEWRYVSGWRYASLFFCLAAVENTNPPAIQIVAVPTEQLIISANWEATGLRGTQSVTVKANNIKVSKNHIENYSRILSGQTERCIAKNDFNKRIYSGLFTGVLMSCLLGSILGATESGLEYVKASIIRYPVAGSTYALMSDSGAIRAKIGELHSQLDLYKRAAEYNADIIDRAAVNVEVTLTTQERVENRARAAQVMRGCVNIIQELLWIYGSSGLDRGNPLERIWRDINVGARHGGFTKLVPEEAVGLSLIGRDPRDLTSMF